MARSIDLDKVGLIEVNCSGLTLELSKDEGNRVLVRVESGSGGRRILIKQHEEDARCIVFALDSAQRQSGLSLVKE